MRREDQPTPEAPKKPGNNVPWFAWVIAVLVGGFIILAIIGSLLPPVSEEEDSPPSGASAVRVATPSPTPNESATLTANAAPSAEAVEPPPLSMEALELRVWYQELLEFKDDPSFHTFCYSQGGPYADWVDRGEALEERMDAKGITLNVYAETGILRGEIWTMGVEYCGNEGRETGTTRFFKGNMEPRWLAATPGVVQSTVAAQQRPAAIVPTPTPTPAALSVGLCERPAETAYLNSVTEQLAVLSASSISLGELFGEMGANPLLLFDDDWKLQTVVQLALLQASADGLLNLAAPPSLQSLDAIVKEAATLVESATWLHAQGLDNLDPDALDGANSMILEATPLIYDIPVETARLCGG